MSKNFILELKSLDQNGVLTGYASVFDLNDSHGDVIKNGAFKQSLSSKTPLQIKLLWQHQPELPIGVITCLKEDDYGLYIEAKLLLELKQANEAYILLKNNVINGLSIGYQVKESYYDRIQQKRILTAIDLHEISLVTFPANPKSMITSIKKSDNNPLIAALNRAINILLL